MGKTSRDKGKAGERELAAKLRELGFPARRGQQFNGSDGSADVIGIPGVHIECKRAEQLRLYEALEQATEDAREGEVPMVMHRKNRRGWVCIIALEDLPRIMKGESE